MRALALALVWSLGGCSSVSGPADWLLPDEFTLGQGSAEYDLSGGHMNSEPAYAYDGESESTYAALTWDIPSIRESDGMSRETQRNFALLVDHMVAEEKLDEASDADEEVAATASVGPLTMNLREGVSLPSKEILFGVLGALLLIVLFVRYKASAARRRW